jgi:hypothetical protein
MSDTTLPMLVVTGATTLTARARGYWRTVGGRLRRDYVTLFFASLIVVIDR